jgi:hypothetical protein
MLQLKEFNMSKSIYKLCLVQGYEAIYQLPQREKSPLGRLEILQPTGALRWLFLTTANGRMTSTTWFIEIPQPQSVPGYARVKDTAISLLVGESIWASKRKI